MYSILLVKFTCASGLACTFLSCLLDLLFGQDLHLTKTLAAIHGTANFIIGDTHHRSNYAPKFALNSYIQYFLLAQHHLLIEFEKSQFAVQISQNLTFYKC